MNIYVISPDKKNSFIITKLYIKGMHNVLNETFAFDYYIPA
jgi:hypothetical protein